MHNRLDSTDIIVALGLVILTIGAWLIWYPLAFVLVGAAMLAFGLARARYGAGRGELRKFDEPEEEDRGDRWAS